MCDDKINFKYYSYVFNPSYTLEWELACFTYDKKTCEINNKIYWTEISCIMK